MLQGLLGTTVTVGTQPMPVIKAESVINDFGGLMSVVRGKRPEDPRDLVVTFSLLNDNGTPARATIEWGAGGYATQITNVRIYSGLQIPLRGSWVRVTMLPQPGGTQYQGGAFVSYGRTIENAVVVVNEAQVNGLATNVLALNFENLSAKPQPYLGAVKIVGAQNAGAGPLVDVTVKIDNNGVGIPYEMYRLVGGAQDQWHDIPLSTTTAATVLRVSITNNDAAIIGVTLLGKLKL